MVMGKDNFLYLVTENDIYRVKLDGKLRTRRCPESLEVDSSEEFECIKLCMPADYVFPYDMQPITLDSDMCLVGGYFDQGHPNVNDLSFVINPNQNNTVLRAGPNLRHSSPTKCCVILSQLGSSLYVVDLGDTGFYLLEPNNSTGRGYTKRRLPSIPSGLANSTWGRVIQNHTSWGHKIHCNIWSGSYVFDTRTETWCMWPDSFRGSVEYRGFFIGLLPSGKIVYSRIDSDGNPAERPLNELHDMNAIFKLKNRWPSYQLDRVFMGLYEDGEDDIIWSLHTVSSIEESKDDALHTRLVLFRVSVDNDSVLSVDVEGAACYNFVNNGHLSTAFVCATSTNDKSASSSSVVHHAEFDIYSQELLDQPPALSLVFSEKMINLALQNYVWNRLLMFGFSVSSYCCCYLLLFYIY
ncbi:hypothetical protein OROMI_026878 [Orobanche minor]